MTDNELSFIVGNDVFKAIKRAENQLGDGIVDRNRVVETAKKIQQVDGKSKLLPEHIFEALQYETGYPDNWQDLRNAINKGGIDLNSESVERQIEVGVKLPKDIVEEFKKSERYKNANPELVKAVEELIGKPKEAKSEQKAEKPTEQKPTIEQQVKTFGVAEKLVKPVVEVANALFSGLKKAGLVAKESVEDWLNIESR